MSTYSTRGESGVAKERGLETTETEVNIQEWGLELSAPSSLGQPSRHDVGSMYCERLVPPQAVAVHPYAIPDSSFSGTTKNYRKIPKITALGLLFFKGPFWGAYFWRGLYSEGLMYGGKFAFKNRLGLPYSWQEINRFSLFFFLFEGNFQVQAPRGLYWFRGGI